MKPIIFVFILLLFLCSAFSQQPTILSDSDNNVPDKNKIYINSNKIPKELIPYLGNMKFVPAQTFHFGQYHINSIIPEKEEKVSVNAFYISATEVTNASYREFCKDKGNKYLPDTSTWLSKTGYFEPYAELYFRHPAYNDYPVVGVNYEKAVAYCQWYNEKVKTILEKYPEIKEKLVLNDFRLPMECEWECSAKGGNDDAIYSFGDYLYYYGKHGEVTAYANFGRIRDITDNIIYGMFEDLYDITAPVKSFKPNSYGLYNMSGNVGELTSTAFVPDTIKNIVGDLSYNSDEYVIKGGGWKDAPYYLRISAKKPLKKDEAACDVGFRIAMSYNTN
ncbi:MAG: SUMF1/EgtB/PvdO family nonheme iron enzyme [Bacteroidota bacterium]